MKGFNLEDVLKDWLKPSDMGWFDELAKYLEELGDRVKNIKSVDEAYDLAKELGMKCTKEEFKQGAAALEYIGDQIEKKNINDEKKAKNAYLDAVAAYKTAEKHLNDARAEYEKFAGELTAEFKANRKLASEELKAAQEKENAEKAEKEEKKADKEEKKAEKEEKKAEKKAEKEEKKADKEEKKAEKKEKKEKKEDKKA